MKTRAKSRRRIERAEPSRLHRRRRHYLPEKWRMCLAGFFLGLYVGAAVTCTIYCSDSEPTGSTESRPTELPAPCSQLQASLGPSPLDLPNDCGIVAAEAASRLAATGAWVHVMHISFVLPHIGVVGHAVTIWQMPASKAVFCYDEFLIGGSLELGTYSHDCKAIARALSKRTGVEILEAHFI